MSKQMAYFGVFWLTVQTFSNGENGEKWELIESNEITGKSEAECEKWE